MRLVAEPPSKKTYRHHTRYAQIALPDIVTVPVLATSTEPCCVRAVAQRCKLREGACPQQAHNERRMKP